MKTTLLIFVNLFVVLAAPLGAQNVLQTVDGASGGDRLGWSAASAGDVDGDGLNDVIAGAPRADINGSSSGSAHVISGATGLQIWARHGDGSSDQFGRAVGGVGDWNGDGRDEFVAGAPLDDDNGAASGMARVFNGIDGSIRHTFLGDAAGDEFGAWVAGAGDVNGDTVPDLIVGAPQPNTAGNGYARIFSGATGGVIRTHVGIESQSQFGISVDGAGDIDKDGFDDVIIGAWLDDTPGTSRGRAYVYSGQDGSLIIAHDGEVDHDWFGWAVAGVGDVDDDTWPDVAVAAYGSDPGGLDAAGRVFVFSGADDSLLLVLAGDEANQNFGFAVDGAGDTNGDGHADILVGAPFGGAGRARIFSGDDGAELLRIEGDGSGDTFGRGVAGLGDLNGDGHGDVAVGAPLDDDNGSSSGRVTIVSGFQPWADLGNGLAGTHGVPLLVGTGTLISGEPLSIALTGALENVTAFFIVGFVELNAPFKGGVLVPDLNPPGFIIPLPTGATGSITLPAAWPAGVPSAFTTFMQDWLPDPAGVVGFAASNAIGGTTP